MEEPPSEPRGSVRIKEAAGAACGILLLGGRTPYPHRGEAAHAADIPLGEVQGRAQGFWHGRLGAAEDWRNAGRGWACIAEVDALRQPQCSTEPPEAKAARPPKGGSFFLRVGCGSGEYVFGMPLGGKAEGLLGCRLGAAKADGAF